ncbi:hypothetical protein CXB51_006211 [Gossypium anomalum]|uniref:Uncharacterized protein n=1 Tax=Gossypium anomalum TaxID=47600 RepID=A0A8J6DA99_9ROSI|nr:hypothetical protein CXB51_006211 [Gossypium anomalum]
MKEKTAVALWKRQEQICMSKTLTSKLHIKQRLYAHRLEEGASVHEHLTMFKEILSNLEAMEVYRESLTVDEVYDSLTSYNKMKHIVVKPDSQGEGLIVHERQDQNADDDHRRTQERNPRDKSKGRSKSSNRVASINNSKVSEEWILNSGCTFHMSPNRDWFTTYETVSEGVILMRNNASCKIASVGTIKVKMFDRLVRTLSDVRHVPELKRNLISLSTLNSKGYRYIAESGALKISKVVASSSLSDDDITKLCHIRLRHISENGMAELSKRELLYGQGICKLNFFEHCIFGKQKRVRFTKGIHNTKGKLEYIHSDLWEPSRVPSRGGTNYMLTFVDDFSRKTGKQIKHLCTDNGLEFYSDKFNELCKSEKIVRHLTAEATSTACFLINRSPSFAVEKKTSQEVWFGNPTDYSNLKIFGYPAYAHVNNEKLEPRSIKNVFLGYKVGVKEYKLWCPKNKKVVISRDIVFDETVMLPNLSLKDSSNKENQKQVEHQINSESTTEPTLQASTKIHNRVISSPQYSIAKNRTRREIKPPKKYAEANLVAYALNVAKDIDANQEPSNYSEAVSCEDSEKWMFAMQEEMESFHKNRTWDLVKLSKGKKVVRCKWVFKKKEGTPGVEEPRYKVRLVAEGYSQIPGVDFTDMFSPVVKHSSIRALLGIVAIHDLELE